MSDFFTRLAERTLGLAPTIQPMIPSLFAPEPEVDLPGDLLLEITEESEKNIAADHFSGNTESPMLSLETTTHLTQPSYPPSMQLQHEESQPFSITSSATAPQQQSAFTRTGERQAKHMPDHLTTRNEASTTGISIQPTRRGSQRTQPVQPATVSSAQVQTPSFAPMNAQTSGMARRTGEIPETTATFPASSMTDDTFTHNTLNTHVSTVLPTSEQQAIRGTTSHKQGISHHTLVGVPAQGLLSMSSMTGFSQIQQMQKMQQSLQPQQLQLETKPPEPDIQVTIGRVEVRAVPAPPKSTHPQLPSDRPPAMSLDEYLRQQERGVRR